MRFATLGTTRRNRGQLAPPLAYDGEKTMYRFRRHIIVLGGYAAALLGASAISYIWPRDTGPDSNGGMAAFGDFLLFCGLFGVMALVPTVLAFYYLRRSEWFWNTFSVASLAFAATGPVAAAMMGRTQQAPWAVLLVGLFGLLRLLGAPLLGFCFLIAAFLASFKRARQALLAAALIEGVVAAYVFFSLVVRGRWL